MRSRVPIRVNAIIRIRDIREKLSAEEKRELCAAACSMWSQSFWGAGLGITLILLFAKSFPYSRLVFAVASIIFVVGTLILTLLVLPRLPRGEPGMLGRAWRAPMLVFVALIGTALGSVVFDGASVLVPAWLLVLFGLLSFIVSGFLLALAL